MKRCRLKRSNFQIKNDMSKETQNTDRVQNGNDFIADVMQWVAVKDRLPVELDEEPHKKKLWVQTENFGCTVAFFKDGEFMKDYSAKLLNVIRWMELPEPPCA